MVRPDFLARFGIFTAPRFLDPETCDRVRDEMVTAAGAPATVTVRLTHDELAERYRRTTITRVSDATMALLRDRILAMKQPLERSFSRPLGRCETPQFLLYRVGDFIRPHSDGSRTEGAPDWLKKRRVSIVVFLNDQTNAAAPGTYGGGALTFYRLLSQDPRGGSIGMPIAGVAGLLVAFPADMVHGVTEVVRGERCTVVTWFGDDESDPPDR